MSEDVKVFAAHQLNGSNAASAHVFGALNCVSLNRSLADMLDSSIPQVASDLRQNANYEFILAQIFTGLNSVSFPAYLEDHYLTKAKSYTMSSKSHMPTDCLDEATRREGLLSDSTSLEAAQYELGQLLYFDRDGIVNKIGVEIRGLDPKTDFPTLHAQQTRLFDEYLVGSQREIYDFLRTFDTEFGRKSVIDSILQLRPPK